MSLFAKDKSKVKRSVDLSAGTDAVLDLFRGLSEKRGISLSRGAAIDAVLGAVLQLKPEQAVRLRNEALKGLKTAQDMLDTTCREDALSFRGAAEDVEGWRNVAELFDILADGCRGQAPMRAIQMNGRRLLIPDAPGWVLVNEEDAARSTDATIVEIKNGARFRAPHFVYFDDGESEPEAIDAAILAAYPRYKDILAARVEPMRDADGNCLNLEQVKQAPAPGYFPALPHDPVGGNPYGVVVIPEKGGLDQSK